MTFINTEDTFMEALDLIYEGLGVGTATAGAHGDASLDYDGVGFTYNGVEHNFYSLDELDAFIVREHAILVLLGL